MCAIMCLNIQFLALWKRVSEGQGMGLLQRRMSLFNDSKESRYDIESSSKTDVAGAAATLRKRTYSPVHLFSYSLFKKCAFTLAEVLITLGIIGIVAAMTMPALVSKYQEKAWLTAFNKTYSILSQVYISAYRDNGIAREWGTEPVQIYNILSPYLNVCEVWGQNRPAALQKLSREYRDLNGRKMNPNDIFSTTSYNFSLNDGTIISLGYSGDIASPLLKVDINGFKLPNQLGKDLFYFSFNDKSGYPVVTGFSKWWMYDGVYCSTKTQNGWYSGGGCALWVIATGNMDYLHRDIPADEWRKAIFELVVKSGHTSLD